MKGTTLRALGLNIGDVDARVLLDEGFDCSGYGLTKAGTRKLALLRTFINEYREDLSKEPGKCIRNSSDAAALMASSLRGLDHEELWVAFLNRANIVIDTVRMTTGSMTSTVIDNTRILRTAILKKASGVILFHNHLKYNGGFRKDAADTLPRVSCRTVVHAPRRFYFLLAAPTRCRGGFSHATALTPET